MRLRSAFKRATPPRRDYTKANQAAGTNPVDKFRRRFAADRQPQEHIVAKILRRASDKLDPEACGSQITTSEAASRPRSPGLRNRIVILGGPGQGKSTLGQFLAQTTRARLLKEQDPSHLQPETIEILLAVLRRAKEQGLPLAGPARFPVRIDLPRFADELKREEENQRSLTLIKYIASRLSRGTDTMVSAPDVRAWFGSCPALVILDGLDEVPSSGNRVQVIAAINAFWDDLFLVQSDVMVLVTTRPQGYNHDLDPSYWQHWELALLSTDKALAYANILCQIRLSDEERRQSIAAELRRASSDPTTRLLMTSPLQVTIMFGIAHLKGKIPQGRWDLFNKYYTLLRDREAQKPGHPAEVLRNFKSQIDALHKEAGFSLQVMAESAGAAAAYLTVEQFRALAARILDRDGYTEGEVKRTAEELLHIATNRLVLLAARTEGRIAFDIRSLQEFMAASEITTAASISLVARLRAIATNAHWRHVFRIAASKVFSEDDLRLFRDDVLCICDSIDNEHFGRDGSIIRGGARLALDLAADGIAAAFPRHHKILIRRACSIMDLGPEAVETRLVDQWSPAVSDVMKEEILRRIAQGATSAALGAWSVTIASLDKDRAFAEDIIRNYWPLDNPSLALDILASATARNLPSDVIELAKLSQWSAGPARCLDRIATSDMRISRDRIDWAKENTPWLDRLTVLPLRTILDDVDAFRRQHEAEILPTRLTGHFCSVSQRRRPKSLRIPKRVENHRIDWQALASVIDFTRAPSKARLASALRSLAETELSPQLGLLALPWVLRGVLWDHDEGVGLDVLAAEAEGGRFGDLSDWLAAEERWSAVGMLPTDFATWARGRYISDNSAIVGCVPTAYSGVSGGTMNGEAAVKFLDIVDSMDQYVAKQCRLLLMLLFAFLGLEDENYTVAPDLLNKTKDTLEKVLKRASVSDTARLVVAATRSRSWFWRHETLVEAADRVGRSLRSPVLFFGSTPVVEICASFNASPDRRGLLPLAASCAVRERSEPLVERALGTLDQSAFDFSSSDEPAVTAAVSILRLVTARRLNDEDAVDTLIDSLISSPEWCSNRSLRALLDSPAGARESRDRVLVHLATALQDQRIFEQSGLPEALSASWSARPSSLSDSAVREDLKLPAEIPTVA